MRGLSAPHCGFSVRESDDSGVRRFVAETGTTVLAVVDTFLEDGGVLLRRRLAPDEPVRAWFSSSLVLYTVLSDGGIGQGDAGAGPEFSYEAKLSDGGVSAVTERHTLLGRQQVLGQPLPNDDLSTACCAAVGSGAPVALALVLLVLRRRKISVRATDDGRSSRRRS